jgi:hypothetical protein
MEGPLANGARGVSGFWSWGNSEKAGLGSGRGRPETMLWNLPSPRIGEGLRGPKIPRGVCRTSGAGWAGASRARALREQVREGWASGMRKQARAGLRERARAGLCDGASRRGQGAGRREQGASRACWLREHARAGAGRVPQSASRADQLFERGVDSSGRCRARLCQTAYVSPPQARNPLTVGTRPQILSEIPNPVQNL